jgi:hypothetical protein
MLTLLVDHTLGCLAGCESGFSVDIVYILYQVAPQAKLNLISLLYRRFIEVQIPSAKLYVRRNQYCCVSGRPKLVSVYDIMVSAVSREAACRSVSLDLSHRLARIRDDHAYSKEPCNLSEVVTKPRPWRNAVLLLYVANPSFESGDSS